MEPKSPALQVDSLSSEPPGKPKVMVVIVISKIQTYPVKFTGILILLKWLLIDNNKPVYTLVLTPTVFAGTYPDITHSTPTPKTSESGKRLTPKAVQPLQGTKSTKTRSPGPAGMNYPVRKILTPPIPALESETPETKEGGQPKDSHREKLLLCSSDFCSGRGIYTMQGELRKCNCLMGYSGDFCEEAAHGPAPGHIALSLTIALLVVLVILGAFVYFRRERKLKR